MVFGAGAIGQWLGAALARGGCQVTLIARASHCQAIRSQGLRTPEGVARVEAFEQVGMLAERDFDLLLLTVKAHDVGAALADLAGLRFGTILTVQNGIGTDDAVMQARGDAQLLIGTSTTVVSQSEPGCVQPEPRGGMGLAAGSPGSDAQPLADLLRRSGIKSEVFGDYRSMKWSKLCLNVVGNATGALLDMTPRELFSDRRLFRLEARSLSEVRRVVRRLGLSIVNLPDYTAHRLVEVIYWVPSRLSFPFLGPMLAKGRGDKPPSLLLELRAGRQAHEVDYLNGAVVAAGERTGVPTPIHRFLTRSVHEAAADPAAWERYRRRPEALLEEIQREKA